MPQIVTNSQPIWAHSPPRLIRHSDSTSDRLREAVRLIVLDIERRLNPVTRLRNQLEALLDVDDANGYRFRPTGYAYQNAQAYLEGLGNLVEPLYFGSPSLTSDGEGGIDIEWEGNGRQVTLSCRAGNNQQDFLYRQEGDSYEARDLTPDTLQETLIWLGHYDRRPRT